jgi:hypothetical protein
MGTVHKEYTEYKVNSASGALAAGFDGISLTNFHTLSCRGTAFDTFLGISVNSGAVLATQWNPNSATVAQTNQIVAQILMCLGKGR